jgi:hypothetical protein
MLPLAAMFDREFSDDDPTPDDSSSLKNDDVAPGNTGAGALIGTACGPALAALKIDPIPDAMPPAASPAPSPTSVPFCFPPIEFGLKQAVNLRVEILSFV